MDISPSLTSSSSSKTDRKEDILDSPQLESPIECADPSRPFLFVPLRLFAGDAISFRSSVVTLLSDPMLLLLLPMLSSHLLLKLLLLLALSLAVDSVSFVVSLILNFLSTFLLCNSAVASRCLGFLDFDDAIGMRCILDVTAILQ